MADRQRSFADMFPDLIGSLTQGAQWKRGMTPLSEKEMTLSKERALTQEQRKWKKDQMMKEWLDFGPHGLGGEAGREPPISSQVLDYASMWPGNILRRGTQSGMWDMVPEKIKKRIKRHMKESGETRVDPRTIPNQSMVAGRGVTKEDEEAYRQVSDRMGYNPTDWYVGEPRSPEDHAQDLAERFHQYLRDMDVREATAETVRDRPDPDRDMSSLVDYMRWVARRGQRASERQEAGLPRIRGETERFQQADRAMQKRYESLNDAVIDRLPSDFQSSALGEPSSKPSQSILDLLNRTMGRKLSRDKPSINR